MSDVGSLISDLGLNDEYPMSNVEVGVYNTSLFDIGYWIFDIYTGVLAQNNVE